MTTPPESDTVDLLSLSGDLLARARDASSGRATHAFRGRPDGMLTQVLLALTEGQRLSDHENPGEAVLHVLVGRVRLGADDDRWELGPHEHLVIPERRHNLVALEDAAVLLTIVKRP